MSRESITRGNLPHWYVPGAAHFVTYRLAGTLPRNVLETLRARKDELLQRPLPQGTTSQERRRVVHKQLFAEYDNYLDSNRAIDWLARPAVAAMIRRNLYHHNAKKYHLLAYCIMPNHVHVLLQPIAVDEAARFVESSPATVKVAASPTKRGRFVYDGEEPCGEEADDKSPLSAVMHSLKSYTAHEANKLLRRKGQFWQHESYDHWVRDDDELERIVEYIDANPVKAGLVTQPYEWYFGSAHDRYLWDGGSCGYLGDMT